LLAIAVAIVGAVCLVVGGSPSRALTWIEIGSIAIAVGVFLAAFFLGERPPKGGGT
jgi:hypothetical protein